MAQTVFITGAGQISGKTDHRMYAYGASKAALK